MSFFSGVDTAEVKLGTNLKINLNLNRQSNDDIDITYLVSDVLHLCMCGHIYADFLSYVTTNVMDTLICKSVPLDHEQRSTVQKWPFQDKWSSTDFPFASHHQRNAAIVPHHRLLPY